ncbi:MAG: hypothetical protein K5928_00105 [Prevotella sp.]|nr:hypothetical protein [Prevotella sp.]
MKFALEKKAVIAQGGDLKLRVLVCTVWASMLYIYILGVIKRIPFLGDAPETTLTAAMALLSALALPAMRGKICMADILFFALNVLYYLSSYVFFPENATAVTENMFFCMCCVLPCYFIGRLTDIDSYFNSFTILSAICIFADLYFFFSFAPSQKNMTNFTSDDNMWVAYQILPHIAMMLWATLRKFHIWKLTVLFLGTMFLLSCGTRGPFVCLGFFGLVYFIFYMKFKGAIYLKIGILAAMLTVILFLKDIIYYLVVKFTGLNMSTRILEKTVSGDLSNDSQRGALREILYNILDGSGHFWGLGPLGTQNYGIIYAHFLPLDFFCTYGYLAGSILLVLLTALVAAAFWVTRGKMTQEFVLLLFSISIVKLMLSNTFLFEPWFYFFIGFCASEVLRAVVSHRNHDKCQE